MGIFGLFVPGRLPYKRIFQQVPIHEAIGAAGTLALAANAVCFALSFFDDGLSLYAIL